MTDRRATRRAVLAHGAAFGPVLLGGCGTWSLPRPGPMDLLHLDADGPYAAPTLLVMLPGAYSAPQEFIDEGFVDAVRRAGVHADVVLAGATLDHYLEGQVVERLHRQVVAPARARGVRHIWLVGVSLGGLFALSHASRHGADLAGVLLLAPYLGRRTLLAEIESAGGPERWADGRRPQGDDLLEHEVWQWLATRPAQPPLYLGYGTGDRFADAHRRLAQRLPRDHVTTGDGGHDWPVWRGLWQGFLARGALGA